MNEAQNMESYLRTNLNQRLEFVRDRFPALFHRLLLRLHRPLGRERAGPGCAAPGRRLPGQWRPARGRVHRDRERTPTHQPAATAGRARRVPEAPRHPTDRPPRPAGRNVAFIANLMESGVDFIACDMSRANRLTIHILAAVAEHEREMISQRTKAALADAKRRGPGYTVILLRPRLLYDD